MRKLQYIALFATLIFITCTSEDIPDENMDNNIEIFLSVSNFQISNTTSRSTRPTNEGSETEQQIDNIYLFLFDSEGGVDKYNVTSSSFAGVTWSVDDAKIVLNLTQVAAGTRDVYIVANYPSTMQSALSEVATVAELQAVMNTMSNPWSTMLGAPILMSGSVEGHNFINNRQLSAVTLIRAVAKLELNIKLKTERQSTPTIEEGVPGNTTTVHQYKYQFVNFDKNTYVLKPTTKTNDLTSFTGWENIAGTSGEVASYILTDGVVTGLKLTTYINERDVFDTTYPRSAVELSLPFISDGPLPPPEFGDEIYKLLLPASIERNTWYVYDIEI